MDTFAFLLYAFLSTSTGVGFIGVAFIIISSVWYGVKNGMSNLFKK